MALMYSQQIFQNKKKPPGRLIQGAREGAIGRGLGGDGLKAQGSDEGLELTRADDDGRRPAAAGHIRRQLRHDHHNTLSGFLHAGMSVQYAHVRPFG